MSMSVLEKPESINLNLVKTEGKVVAIKVETLIRNHQLRPI